MQYHVSQKNVRCMGFFYNLQQLEPIFIIFGTQYISLKWVDDFPSHLSCVATLPQNTLATKQARCFPLDRWLRKDNAIMMWVCLLVCLFVFGYVRTIKGETPDRNTWHNSSPRQSVEAC